MNRAWWCLLVMLAGCEPDPSRPVSNDVETKHFEMSGIRKAVDDFKTEPSDVNRHSVERAFSLFDRRLKTLEMVAATQTGEEQAATLERVRELKRSRELHYARYLTPWEEKEPIRVAERVTPTPKPVAERVLPVRRAEPVYPMDVQASVEQPPGNPAEQPLGQPAEQGISLPQPPPTVRQVPVRRQVPRNRINPGGQTSFWQRIFPIRQVAPINRTAPTDRTTSSRRLPPTGWGN